MYVCMVCMYVHVVLYRTWLLQVEESGVGIVSPQLFQFIDLGGCDLPGAKLLLLSRNSNLDSIGMYVCMYVCMFMSV